MKKKLVVALVFLLCLTTFVFAACGGTTVAEVKAKGDFFTQTDGVFAATVTGDVTEVDILGNLEVNEGFTLKLYSDKELTAAVEGKAKLNVGVNTFYVNAEPTGKGEAKSYTVRITREAVYKITFKDGDTIIKEVTVSAGQKVDESAVTAPGKQGYTFAGWKDFDFNTAPTSDMTVEAQWTANTDTPYVVQHYKQNADKDGYDLVAAVTENLTGTTDATVTATPKVGGDFAGFVVNNDLSVMSGKVAADGSLVLKVYYDIAQIAYKVQVYVENTDNNEYSLDVSLGKTLYADDGESITYTPDSMTGFTVVEDLSDLEITVDGENPNANVVNVYYKRVRTQVSFKQTDNDQSPVTLTAKYGVGLVKADGTAATAPAFSGEPSATANEFYWAKDGTTVEADFTAMTESAVTVVKKERVAVYNIDFDLNLESDYFKDGYSIEITGNKTEYNKGDKVEFTVSLNDSYNKNINVDSQLSNVQFVFRASNASAGAGTVISCEPHDTLSGVYVYSFTATASGTVSQEGEFEENTYKVSGQLELAGDWGKFDSLDGVTVEISQGADVSSVLVGEDGNFSVDLKAGTYGLTILFPDGTYRSVNELEIATSYDDPEELLTYSYDFGKIKVGLVDVSGSLKVNFDGTIDTVPTAQNNVVFSNFSAKEYAVKATAQFVDGTEGDPGLGFRIRESEKSIEFVLMRDKIRINGTGFDWDKDRIDIKHGLTGLWEKGGNAFEYTLYKSADAFLMYARIIGVDDEPVRVARITATQAYIYKTDSYHNLSSLATGVINNILASDNTAEFYSSVNITGGATLEVTYNDYGYKTSGIGNTVKVPASVDGGIITSSVTDFTDGATVVITATPDNGKRVKSFLVKVNDGSFVSVEESDIQGNFTGNVNDGYNFNFVADKAYSYEFKVEFEEGIVRNDYIGKVADMDNDAPVANASVVAYDVVEGVRGNAFAETTTGEDGTFTIKLGATTYELEFKAENYYAYSTRVEMGENATDESDTPVQIKKMTVGGVVSLNERVFTSNTESIIPAYNYETGKETASTKRTAGPGDQPFMFTVTGENAVIKYTVKLDGMDSSEANKEFWPGVGIDLYNANGDNMNFRLLRDGVSGTGTTNNIYGVYNNTRYDFENGFHNVDVSGEKGTVTVDVMFVKQGDKVHAFSKLPEDEKYSLVYSFAMWNNDFIGTQLAYGIKLACNGSAICWIDYSNISIDTSEAAVTQAMEGYTVSPFDFGIHFGTRNQAAVLPMGEGAYKIAGNNATRAMSSQNKYGDFIVSATFVNEKYDHDGKLNEGSEAWNSLGFAIGTDEVNNILLAEAGKSLRAWYKWDNEFTKKEGDLAGMALDKKIIDVYTANGGKSNYAIGARNVFTLIRKDSTIYMIRDGIYLAKIAAEDGEVNFYYADGTKATDYGFRANDTSLNLKQIFLNVLTAPEVMLGVGGHGNSLMYAGVENYSVTSEGVNEAVAALEAGMKNAITVSESEFGTASVTVDGGEYVSGTTITAGKPVTVTFTPQADPKYMVSDVKLSIDGAEDVSILSELQAGAGYVRTYTFAPLQKKTYKFTVTYEKVPSTVNYSAKVLDFDDKVTPLAGITVTAKKDGLVAGSATTGDDGAYTIEGLMSGTYDFVFSANNYYERTVTGIEITANEGNDGDTITGENTTFKAMVVGGSTTLTGGTTVSANRNGLNIVFDYESGNLTASTVEGSNTGAQLDGRTLTFTGIKDKYAMAKFTYTNQGGGTEGDPGIGISFFDGTNEVALVFRQDGARLTAPAWVSTIGMGLNSGYQINNPGSYDLMIVRADTTYYMFSKPAASPNWEMIYSATESELRTLGKLGDTEAKLTGEAGLFIRMTVGPALSINAQFSNFETAEGKEAIDAIIGSHTITVNDVANAEIAVTGDGVTSEAGEGKTVYTVPLGKTVNVSVNATSPDYLISGLNVNGTTLQAKLNYTFTKLGNNLEITAVVEEFVGAVVTGKVNYGENAWGENYADAIGYDGVTVTFNSAKYNYETEVDGQGQFSIELPLDTFDVTVSSPDFMSYTDTLTVKSTDAVSWSPDGKFSTFKTGQNVKLSDSFSIAKNSLQYVPETGSYESVKSDKTPWTTFNSIVLNSSSKAIYEMEVTALSEWFLKNKANGNTGYCNDGEDWLSLGFMFINADNQYVKLGASGYGFKAFATGGGGWTEGGEYSTPGLGSGVYKAAGGVSVKSAANYWTKITVVKDGLVYYFLRDDVYLFKYDASTNVITEADGDTSAKPALNMQSILSSDSLLLMIGTQGNGTNGTAFRNPSISTVASTVDNYISRNVTSSDSKVTFEGLENGKLAIGKEGSAIVTPEEGNIVSAVKANGIYLDGVADATGKVTVDLKAASQYVYGAYDITAEYVATSDAKTVSGTVTGELFGATAGTVYLTNTVTGITYTADYTDSAYTVSVPAGTYEIVAKSSVAASYAETVEVNDAMTKDLTLGYFDVTTILPDGVKSNEYTVDAATAELHFNTFASNFKVKTALSATDYVVSYDQKLSKTNNSEYASLDGGVAGAYIYGADGSNLALYTNNKGFRIMKDANYGSRVQIDVQDSNLFGDNLSTVNIKIVRKDAAFYVFVNGEYKFAITADGIVAQEGVAVDYQGMKEADFKTFAAAFVGADNAHTLGFGTALYQNNNAFKVERVGFANISATNYAAVVDAAVPAV